MCARRRAGLIVRVAPRLRSKCAWQTGTREISRMVSTGRGRSCARGCDDMRFEASRERTLGVQRPQTTLFDCEFGPNRQTTRVGGSDPSPKMPPRERRDHPLWRFAARNAPMMRLRDLQTARGAPRGQNAFSSECEARRTGSHTPRYLPRARRRRGWIAPHLLYALGRVRSPLLGLPRRAAAFRQTPTPPGAFTAREASTRMQWEASRSRHQQQRATAGWRTPPQAPKSFARNERLGYARFSTRYGNAISSLRAARPHIVGWAGSDGHGDRAASPLP